MEKLSISRIPEVIPVPSTCKRISGLFSLWNLDLPSFQTLDLDISPINFTHVSLTFLTSAESFLHLEGYTTQHFSLYNVSHESITASVS